MKSLSVKTKIIFGINSSIEYDYSCSRYVLIVTDKVMRSIGLCSIIEKKLLESNISYTIFDEVEPNPSFETIINGVLNVAKKSVDTIIALGGGSVIDASKGFIYYYEKLQKEQNKEFIKPILIAIPTTSGAGSEVTSYTVITDTKNKLKVPIVSDNIIPDVAILDPIMTKTCPQSVTAESGIDVLTHILESYVSNNSSTFTEAIAEKAIQIVFNELVNTFENGNNINARLAMHEASCMAGIAFTNSGLGLNHAMSHALGGRFHISHGRANALLIPHVISFNKSKVGDKYCLLAKLLDFPSSTSEESFLSLLIGIEYLCDKLKLGRSISDYGISKEEYLSTIPSMAKDAINDPCLDTTPLMPTIDDIENIYKALI